MPVSAQGGARVTGRFVSTIIDTQGERIMLQSNQFKLSNRQNLLCCIEKTTCRKS